jgi:hypothetical protein
MTPQQSEQVRQRAFSLWEAAGRPHGHDLDHWLQAEREIDGEKKPAKAAKPRKAAAKSPLAGLIKGREKTATGAKTARAKKS